MKTDPAKAMYEQFLQKIGKSYDATKIQGKETIKQQDIYSDTGDLDGVFGAMMLVDITNDGPVTLELDSRKFTYDS